MTMAVPILINVGAGLGGGADAEERIRAALDEAGVAGEVRAVAASQLTGSLRELARSGARVVGVAGGDGTLLAAAEALAGGETALAPFPTGTLNHFSRRLGISDLATAATSLGDAREARAPVGVMDDRIFLNTATFGIYADVVRRRERWRPYLRKWGAASVSFLTAFIRMNEVEVGLEVDCR